MRSPPSQRCSPTILAAEEGGVRVHYAADVPDIVTKRLTPSKRVSIQPGRFIGVLVRDPTCRDGFDFADSMVESRGSEDRCPVEPADRPEQHIDIVLVEFHGNGDVMVRGWVSEARKNGVASSARPLTKAGSLRLVHAPGPSSRTLFEGA